MGMIIPSRNGTIPPFNIALKRAPINKKKRDYTMYQPLNCTDVNRLVRACELYKDFTGSEFMWDEYDKLIRKLKTFGDQNFEECEVSNIHISHPHISTVE